MPERLDADVRGFFLIEDELQLSQLPKGVDRFFPFLTLYQWMNGNLSSIESADLKPFPDLEIILLPSNKLTSLEGNLFKYTPRIYNIGFQLNLLEKVGEGLLDDLNFLTIAHFYYNPCISFGAETPEAIQELKNKLRIQCHSFLTTSVPPSTIEETTTSVAASTSISTTTDSGYCSTGCIERIAVLESENIRQTLEIERQRAEIIQHNEAITELQMQIREILSNPCSPCGQT